MLPGEATSDKKIAVTLGAQRYERNAFLSPLPYAGIIRIRFQGSFRPTVELSVSTPLAVCQVLTGE